MDPAGPVQHGPHVPGRPHNLKGVSEMNKLELLARETLKNSSLAKLIDLWELTTALKGPQVPTVRGWLMDEIERRNPDGLRSIHSSIAGAPLRLTFALYATIKSALWSLVPICSMFTSYSFGASLPQASQPSTLWRANSSMRGTSPSSSTIRRRVSSGFLLCP